MILKIFEEFAKDGSLSLAKDEETGLIHIDTKQLVLCKVCGILDKKNKFYSNAEEGGLSTCLYCINEKTLETYKDKVRKEADALGDAPEKYYIDIQNAKNKAEVKEIAIKINIHTKRNKNG